jgi:hypothetical protein
VFCSKGAGNAGAATIKRNQEICTSESEIWLNSLDLYAQVAMRSSCTSKCMITWVNVKELSKSKLKEDKSRLLNLLETRLLKIENKQIWTEERPLLINLLQPILGIKPTTNGVPLEVWQMEQDMPNFHKSCTFSKKIQNQSQCSTPKTNLYNINTWNSEATSLTISKWFKLVSQTQRYSCLVEVITKLSLIVCSCAKNWFKILHPSTTISGSSIKREWSMLDMDTPAVLLLIGIFSFLDQEKK